MIFDLKVFRESASRSLTSLELRFLFRTFFRASSYFFGFGLLVFSLGSVFINSITIGGAVTAFLTLMTVPCFIALMFMFWKYRKDPLNVSNFFVGSIYTVLLFSFLGIFLVMIGSLSLILGSGSVTVANFGITTFLIFGATTLIYLIPGSLGLYIRNKGTILSLSKFIFYCYISYIALFVVSFLVGIFGLALRSFLGWMSFALISVVIFASPIVTLYRLKRIAPYIDYENPVEIKKWEHYFAFEISFQLLQMAMHLIRIVLLFLNPRSVAKS